MPADKDRAVLKQAVEKGEVPVARLDDMVHRTANGDCRGNLISLLNIAGLVLEKAGGRSDHFTANFSAWARK